MTRALAVLLAVLAVPIAADQRGRAGGDTPGGSFVLAVLRRDGAAIPFAAYDGRKWRGGWPSDLRNMELPISLSATDRDWWGGQPQPETMRLWADGKAAGDLKLQSLSFLQSRCDRRLVVRTNYHPAVLPPPPGEQPFPKDGLLVSGTQRIDAIETVASDSPEIKEAAEAILKEFNDEETHAAGQFTDWRHPVLREQRNARPIHIERLYRAPMGEPGWTAYYVEAVRRYEPRDEDDDCGLLTSARGWLRKGPGGKKEVTLGAQITFCDRHGVSFMLPLGLVKAASGTYWVYQLAGYYSELYLIAKPTPRTTERILAYSMMACPPWMMWSPPPSEPPFAPSPTPRALLR